MSTQTEITRLNNARNTIRDKLIDLGLAASTDKLDKLAAAVSGITNRGAVSATVQEGGSYTIPEGYHNGAGTVSGVGGGGNYTLQAKSVTPTKDQQSITSDEGYYGLSSVTVAAIPEAYQNVSSVTATASDVLANKIIVTADGTQTAGTMTNNGAVSKTLSVSEPSYTVPAGYHNGSGAVGIVLEEKTAVPGTTSQEITPSSGKVISKVTVSPIPDQYADTSDADASAENILYGKVAYVYNSATGKSAKAVGTMTNNGTLSKTIDGLSVTSVTIDAGYTDGGTVSLTDDIELALAAI